MTLSLSVVQELLRTSRIIHGSRHHIILGCVQKHFRHILFSRTVEEMEMNFLKTFSMACWKDYGGPMLA